MSLKITTNCYAYSLSFASEIFFLQPEFEIFRKLFAQISLKAFNYYCIFIKICESAVKIIHASVLKIIVYFLDLSE